MQKKRILFISQCFPYPLDGGGKIKTYSMLKMLGKYFEVKAIFISERKPSQKQIQAITRLGISGIHVIIATGNQENVKKHLWKLIANYALLRPHYVYQYASSEAAKFVKQTIIHWHPQVIHVDHSNTAQFVPTRIWFKVRGLPMPKLILDEHNVIHKLYFSRLRYTDKPIRRLYLMIEGLLNYLYVLRYYPRFDHIFCISDSEKRFVSKINRSTSSLPITYHSAIMPIPPRTKPVYDLIYVGSLDWPPNREGLTWFLENFDYRKGEHSKKRWSLCIVGHSNELEKLRNDFPSANFVGNQTNLWTFMKGAKVMIIPVFYGSGISYKTITGLTHALPVISTRFGCRGLELSSGIDYLRAETKTEFAQGINKLLADSSLRRQIGQAGKRKIITLKKNAQLQTINMYFHALGASAQG